MRARACALLGRLRSTPEVTQLLCLAAAESFRRVGRSKKAMEKMGKGWEKVEVSYGFSMYFFSMVVRFVMVNLINMFKLGILG